MLNVPSYRKTLYNIYCKQAIIVICFTTLTYRSVEAMLHYGVSKTQGFRNILLTSKTISCGGVLAIWIATGSSLHHLDALYG